MVEISWSQTFCDKHRMNKYKRFLCTILTEQHNRTTPRAMFQHENKENERNSIVSYDLGIQLIKTVSSFHFEELTENSNEVRAFKGKYIFLATWTLFLACITLIYTTRQVWSHLKSFGRSLYLFAISVYPCNWS